MNENASSLAESLTDELNARLEVARDVLIWHVQYINNLVFELL
jgi:hypothetical protein